MGRKKGIPSYRLHKPSGRAVVTIDGKNHYLGQYGTKKSHQEYNQLMARWFAGGQKLLPEPVQCSVKCLAAKYLLHCEQYYVSEETEEPTSELKQVELAMKPLVALFAELPVGEFGPRAFKALREHILDTSDLSQDGVNRRMRHVVCCFRWGVEEELVPPQTHYALSLLLELK